RDPEVWARSLQTECSAPKAAGLRKSRHEDVQAGFHAPPPRSHRHASAPPELGEEVGHRVDPQSATCALIPQTSFPGHTKTRCREQRRQAGTEARPSLGL